MKINIKKRDLAFQHARADASLMHIRTNLEKSVKNEKAIGTVDDKGAK